MTIVSSKNLQHCYSLHWGLGWGGNPANHILRNKRIRAHQVGKQARSFFVERLDSETKRKGMPDLYTSNYIRRASNYDRYLRTGHALPSRPRFNAGFALFSPVNQVDGWFEISILRQAKPNRYDQAYVGLNQPLSYGQVKWIALDKALRGRGLGREMMYFGMLIASRYVSEFIADVKSENEAMNGLMQGMGFKVERQWVSPQNTVMNRWFIQLASEG